jgi:hypothetical protein
MRDRRVRKRDFRRLWIVRIGAAAKLNGISYSHLIHGLKKSGFDLSLVVRIERAKPKLAITVETSHAGYWPRAPDQLFAEFPSTTAPNLVVRYNGSKPEQLPKLHELVARIANRFERVDIGLA